MEVLKDFPEDFAKSLHPSFTVLKIFNVRYLNDDQPLLQKYWHFFYICPTIFIQIFAMSAHMPELLSGEKAQFAYLIPSTLVTFHDLGPGDGSMKPLDVGAAGPAVVAMFGRGLCPAVDVSRLIMMITLLRSMVLIPKTRQVSAFIRELGSLWQVELTLSQRQKRDALLRRLSFNNTVTFWIFACGSFQYLILPLYETLFRRFILKQDCELLLPMASNYPFNPTKNWLIYILVYIFQFYAMELLFAVYTGAAMIMITSCALLGIEFVMLKYDLAQVKPRPNRQRNYDVASDSNDGSCIENFVERHQKLLRLSRQLDNVFNGMVFIDLLFVGITTCAFSFMGQFARSPCYIFLGYIGIASSMLTVFYLCYYGELLTGASSSIGDTAYETLWYESGKQYKIAIFLIIKISQKPCCLTSLRYAVVSMKMFTKVASTTWSYLSLMRSVYSED